MNSANIMRAKVGPHRLHFSKSAAMLTFRAQKSKAVFALLALCAGSIRMLGVGFGGVLEHVWIGYRLPRW
jgi:hypothetical protein